MSDDYKPRFSFEISLEQKNRADRVLTNYGLRKAIFNHILDDVLNLIEEHGGMVVGVLMSGQCKPRDILPTMKEAETAAEKAKGVTNGQP